MLSRRQLLALTPALLPAQLTAQLTAQSRRFNRVFFYLKPDSKLVFTDFAVGSDRRAWATALLSPENSGPKGELYTTNDGGQSWQSAPLKFLPFTLFALDDSSLWSVSDKGEIWFSAEGGRDWKKLSRQKEAQRVHFLDNQNGYLVGTKKTFMRTTDGGRKWTHVPEGAQAPGDADNFIYRSVQFWNGKIGLASGNVEPPTPGGRRASQLPDWMDPEKADFLHSRPRVIVSLESQDAGQTWTRQEVSGFGYIQRSLIGSDGTGFHLLKFRKSFTYGGELYSFYPFQKKPGKLLLREKNLEFHDICYVPGDGLYVACTERLGALPVPTKVRIRYSQDLNAWTDIPVDYRALASRITLGATPGGKVFAVLDQGTILALQ